MKEFTKKYQLWTTPDGVSYIAQEFDTLQECIVAAKSDPWYITKRVSINVVDAEEVPPYIVARPLNVEPAYKPIPLENEDSNPIEEAYLRGGTGTVNP